MSIKQFLRIVWARKWLVLALLVLVSVAGAVTTLLLPKQYTAESAMIVEIQTMSDRESAGQSAGQSTAQHGR